MGLAGFPPFEALHLPMGLLYGRAFDERCFLFVFLPFIFLRFSWVMVLMARGVCLLILRRGLRACAYMFSWGFQANEHFLRSNQRSCREAFDMTDRGPGSSFDSHLCTPAG